MAKKYIVIGAGWFGIRAVQAIESISSDSEIIVLQVGTKDHIDFNQINPRLAVEPTLLDLAYQPLSKAWKRAQLRHIRQVKRVASGEVVIIDNDGVEKTLETDGIVVATGAAYTSTLMTDSQGRSKEERREQFLAFRDAVLNSKAGVVVIGGGVTGTELIAEIATDFTNIKCSLVNKPELLLRGSSKRSSMHNIVMKQLTKLGVNVITDDSIEGVTEDYIGEPKTFTTKKGVSIEADIVILCTGGRPNVPFASDDAIDEKTKGLVVNGAMLCENLGRDPTKPVWAVGDCTQYNGHGKYADVQIPAMSASIKHFQKTGSTKGGPTLYKHKISEECLSLVSVGRRGGASSVPFPNMWLGKALKSKDLGLKYIYNNQFRMKV